MRKQFTIFLILVFILGLVPVNFSKAADLSNKLSGRILLQVEGVGQAWYIDPGTKERAFLGRPTDAFRIMRELGLGISEKNYNSFNGYAPKNLSGRILLRVEANGEAYYINPTDLKMHYLGRPADAFKVMREKGLGITDEDLNKVPVFEKYKEQTEVNTNAIDLLNKKVSELEEKINTNTSTSTNSCTADTWVCGIWGQCSSGGQQTRTCNLTSDCQSVNTPSPSISKSCSYSSNNMCTSWTYSDWSVCSSAGVKTRTILSSSPSDCVGGDPILSTSCVYNQPAEYSDYILNYSLHKDAGRYVVEFSNNQNVTRDVEVRDVFVKVENSFPGEVSWVTIETPNIGTGMNNININDKKYNYSVDFKINPKIIGNTSVKFNLGNQSSSATINTLLDEWIIWDKTINKRIKVQYVEYIEPPKPTPDLIVNPLELPEITAKPNDTGVVLYQAHVKNIYPGRVTITSIKLENSNESFDYNSIDKLYLEINGLAKVIEDPSIITLNSFTFSSLDTSTRVLLSGESDITVKADFADGFATSSPLSLYLKDKYSISAIDMNSGPVYFETDTAINKPSRIINLVK